MTNETMEQLLSRLIRKLGLEEPEDDALTLLEDELLNAEAELLLYLNRKELPLGMDGKLLELAALFYQQSTAEHQGMKSASYSEGQVSQSVSYQTDSDYQSAREALLRSVAHYRRRAK